MNSKKIFFLVYEWGGINLDQMNVEIAPKIQFFSAFGCISNRFQES